MKNYLLLKAQKIMKVCLFSVACVFLLILMLIKPMRVALAHQLPFLSCQGNVCVDDPQQQEKAQKLYNQAIQETQRQRVLLTAVSTTANNRSIFTRLNT